MYVTATNLIHQIHTARDSGQSKRSVAVSLGLSYNTVRSWWNKEARVAQSAEAVELKSIQYRFESDRGYQEAYSYLLGIYLGDGYINLVSAQYQVYQLRIEQHSKYVGLVQEHVSALAVLFPTNIVTAFPWRNRNSTTISVTSKNIPAMFPQFGPGKKHTRVIQLEGWQHRIVSEHPWQFLRGLYQSDGCRYIHRQHGYEYVKYNFTNRSVDIINLFCAICDSVGIQYTIYHRIAPIDIWTVTIGKRADVALCDQHLGPKT